MKDIINIGDVEVTLSNNIAWTMEYRDQFNKDIMETLLPLVASAVETVSAIVEESGKDGQIDVYDIATALQGRAYEVILPLSQLGFTDSVINIVWSMAKAADSNIDPPKQWVRQFETFPLDEVVPKVAQLVLKGFSSSKNLERLRNIGKQMTQPKKKTTKQ